MTNFLLHSVIYPIGHFRQNGHIWSNWTYINKNVKTLTTSQIRHIVRGISSLLYFTFLLYFIILIDQIAHIGRNGHIWSNWAYLVKLDIL